MACKHDLPKAITPHRIPKYAVYGGIVIAFLGCFWFFGCGKRSPGKTAGQPNVLLISLDTVRKDHCSLYGYERDTTPFLRVMAKQATRFDQAYAPSSTTGPSHATFFTSLYPIAHHVLKNGLNLSDEHVTLAEILQTHGFQTAGVVSSFVLHSKFGYAQGFEFYDDTFEQEESTLTVESWEGLKVEGSFDRRADYTTERAIGWLKEDRDPTRPFFLFVHYFDPHAPYRPPKSSVERIYRKYSLQTPLARTISLYDGEIVFTDQQVGNLLTELERMGLENQTLVVITSDHGEGLMQHNHMEHGVNVYDELVRVPLLFRWPGHIPKSQIFSTPVGLIDLAPTILDLMNIKTDGWKIQGESLASVLKGQVQLEPLRPVFFYRRLYSGDITKPTPVKGKKFGIRRGKWKYIEGLEENTKELFDLESDPNELTNLYADFPDISSDLASRLEEWKQANSRAYSTRPEISEEDLAPLKALGYIE